MRLSKASALAGCPHRPYAAMRLSCVTASGAGTCANSDSANSSWPALPTAASAVLYMTVLGGTPIADARPSTPTASAHMPARSYASIMLPHTTSFTTASLGSRPAPRRCDGGGDGAGSLPRTPAGRPSSGAGARGALGGVAALERRPIGATAACGAAPPPLNRLKPCCCCGWASACADATPAPRPPRPTPRATGKFSVIPLSCDALLHTGGRGAASASRRCSAVAAAAASTRPARADMAACSASLNTASASCQ
eukprot:362866-Chlamydomonas_euryale.AAC.7